MKNEITISLEGETETDKIIARIDDFEKMKKAYVALKAISSAKGEELLKTLEKQEWPDVEELRNLS